MTDLRYSIPQLRELLEQGRRLIDALDEELYRRTPEPIATSPVGAHVRHVLDCCRCFLDGLPERRVDYDLRTRDLGTELDPRVAIGDLSRLSTRLAALEDLDPTTELRVRSDAPEGTDAGWGWRSSTVGRELLYLLSHTVHHYALIAMILRHLGIDPGEELGVAPSTLRYWKESGGCAPLVG